MPTFFWTIIQPLQHKQFEIMAAKQIVVGLYFALLMVSVFAQEPNDTIIEEITDENNQTTTVLTTASIPEATENTTYTYVTITSQETTTGETSPCISNPCQNEGQCEPVSKDEFNCTCSADFAGKICNIRDLCAANEDDGEKCKNGVCTIDDSKQQQSCVCSEGYHLDEVTLACKKIAPPCSPNPCKNKGSCTVLSEKEYNCSCLTGFEGNQCELENKCKLEEGICNGVQCIMNYERHIYYCQCPDDQHFDYSIKKCKDTDFCPLMVCKSNEVCEDSVCNCLENFKRNNKTGICEPNFCASKKCPSEEMICEENADGNPENFRCSCKENYSFNGTNCTFAACSTSILNGCQQLCEEIEGGYECKCEDSFQLKPDNKSCDFLGNETCLNATCKPGFCLRKDGQEQCLCPPGFENQDGKCIDLCSAGNLPTGICPDDKCETVDTGFQCACTGRYKMAKDKVTCVERNMCDENEIGWKQCQEKQAICISDWTSNSGFECKCRPGFEMPENGICKKICDMEENVQNCSRLGGTCDLDLDYKFTCRCPPSFQQFGNTGSCSEIAKYSYLVNLPVEVEHYNEKSQFSLRSVQAKIAENMDYHKLWKDIMQSMKELFEVFEYANVLECRQTDDVFLCTVELQFRELIANDLERIKMITNCHSNDTISEKKCIIPPSLVLRRDKIESTVSYKETDPCDEVVKSQLCEPYTKCSSSKEEKWFSCTCKEGFKAYRKLFPHSKAISFIEMCQDIDECSEANICPKSTVCSNTVGSYNCFCVPGYRVINDSSDPKEEDCVRLCDPNPCAHGLCYSIGDHSFECTCDAGFTGALCNLEDQNYKDAKVNTIIVGAVLGGVLLVVIIIFVSKVSRKRSMKFDDEPNQFLYGSTEMSERRTVRTGVPNDAFQRD